MHAPVRDYYAEHLETFVDTQAVFQCENRCCRILNSMVTRWASSDSNAAPVAHCFSCLELQVQRRSARPEKTRQSTIDRNTCPACRPASAQTPVISKKTSMLENRFRFATSHDAAELTERMLRCLSDNEFFSYSNLLICAEGRDNTWSPANPADSQFVITSNSPTAMKARNRTRPCKCISLVVAMRYRGWARLQEPLVDSLKTPHADEL